MSDAATQAQTHAARPHASTWVSANAGSGKTRVLTNRVARLLLAGAAPHRILCLTYTKAAASEMQSRLFAELGTWAMMPRAELMATLAGLGEDTQTISNDKLATARRLFAQALETPGGLKIQTIRGFASWMICRRNRCRMTCWTAWPRATRRVCLLSWSTIWAMGIWRD